MTAARGRASIYLKLVLMALCWGGTFIGGRIATAEIAPIGAALWRYAIATIALFAFVLLIERGLPRLSGREWRAFTLLGVTGVVMFNLCFMYALSRIPASRGSLIMALNPAFTLLGAVFFLHEGLTRNKVAGVLLALAGVVVVLGRGDLTHLFTGGIGAGEIIMFGCPLTWAAYTLFARRLVPNLSALVVTAYAALTGTAMLAVIATVSGDIALPHASLRAWTAIVFIGLFGTALGLVWFYEGVRAIGPARTSVFINLVPVFAISLGVLLLGEPLEPSMLIGGLIVIAGVLLLNRPATTPVRAVAAAE